MTLWQKNVRKVIPYTPGEQPKRTNLVKLNTNENPYPPAPGVIEALKQMNPEMLRRYPDPTVSALAERLAEKYGISSEEIFVGVGSDDVLGMAFLTFFNGKNPIAFPNITYSFYDVWANLFQIPYVQLPLDARLQIRPEDYEGELGGVVIPNPNAPTGVFMATDELEKIIRKNPGAVVIIDEAYVDFAPASCLPLIKKYDNLLVVQTFSKSRSLAGARIGYAMGNPALIAALNSVKQSYNSYTMNSAAIVMGTAALADEVYFKNTVAKIVETRENAKVRFGEMGFSFPDSQTNFLFVTHERVQAANIFQKLREQDIFVRYFNKPIIDQYLRITIGTEEEMEKLYVALKDILS